MLTDTPRSPSEMARSPGAAPGRLGFGDPAAQLVPSASLKKLQDVESNHGCQAYETRWDANPSCIENGACRGNKGAATRHLSASGTNRKSVPCREDAVFKRLAPGQRIKNTHLCSPLRTATAGISRRFFGRFRRAWGLSVSERRH